MLNGGARSLAEARQIARDPAEAGAPARADTGERQLAVDDQGMLRQPPTTPAGGWQGGCARRLVVDGVATPRGRLEMRRSLFSDAALSSVAAGRRAPALSITLRRPKFFVIWKSHQSLFITGRLYQWKYIFQCEIENFRGVFDV